METHTFNQMVGGRNWRSEQELLVALDSTLTTLCTKNNFNKVRLVNAAKSVAPSDFSEWQILEWAIDGAQTMTRKGRVCGVSNAYKGIEAPQVADDACWKCEGSGQYLYSSGAIGICYSCKGSGKEKGN